MFSPPTVYSEGKDFGYPKWGSLSERKEKI
jgi:hypothetical protein